MKVEQLALVFFQSLIYDFALFQHHSLAQSPEKKTPCNQRQWEFQEIGFFENESNSVEKEAGRIISESENHYFGNILKLKDDPLFDQILLSYDKKKVWFIEDFTILGSTVEFKDNFYLNVLKCLGSISNDIFNPENIEIKECGYCEGRDKRLDIIFDLKTESFNINFCIDADVLCLHFLDEINQILDSKGYSFQVITDSYGVFLVLPRRTGFLKN